MTIGCSESSAPEREKTRTWQQFIKAHWDSLCGCDFFTVEALVVLGLLAHDEGAGYLTMLPATLQFLIVMIASGKENAATAKVVCRSRLGGMLNFYVREAA